MKRAKRIYILLGVLAVICIATFAVSRYEERTEQIRSGREVILELDSQAATAVSWDAEGYVYAFHRDGSWVYDEDEDFPVNDEKIDSLIDLFSEYVADFTITDVDDYSQYGLDDPVCTISITVDEEDYIITLGDFSLLDQERYLCVNGGDVYLAETDPLDSFELEMAEIMRHDTVDYITQADTLSFQGAENYSIYYEEESSNTYCPDDVYFVSGSDAPLDSEKVESYLRSFRGTELYEYATYNATDDELELYGMNDPELEITIDYTEEDEDGNDTARSVTLTVGLNQEEQASTETEDNDDEADSQISAYVRVNDSQIIYVLSSSDYANLTAASYDELRHAEVLPVDFADVLRMDIELDGKLYTLYREESGEDEETDIFCYYYSGEVTDPADLDEDDDIENYRKEVDIDSLASVIASVTADTFTNEEPEDKTEITLRVYLENENYPQVNVELYRYDGNSCLAVIDGVPTSLVPRSSVVDLIEAVYEIVL